MNFRPGLCKSVVSVVVGIAGWVYGEGGIKCDSWGGCGYFHGTSVLLGLIGLVVVYVIWSLIQKK